MGEKKIGYGVNFQKHNSGDGSGCCVKSNVIVANNIAAAAQWAADNMPEGEGWTVSVAQINQPVIVL